MNVEAQARGQFDSPTQGVVQAAVLPCVHLGGLGEKEVGLDIGVRHRETLHRQFKRIRPVLAPRADPGQQVIEHSGGRSDPPGREPGAVEIGMDRPGGRQHAIVDDLEAVDGLGEFHLPHDHPMMILTHTQDPEPVRSHGQDGVVAEALGFSGKQRQLHPVHFPMLDQQHQGARGHFYMEAGRERPR
ncbi:MAG: hypothetical protein CVU59_05360 [Deltaproteobacteria bacterium HGW-Deltaproteobacteria-17]|nr:MAG: hypothetical protein CVU59_05360 [Deltaproteobacteria bacterium HGW-Deltaproteobacteria-17]